MKIKYFYIVVLFLLVGTDIQAQEIEKQLRHQNWHSKGTIILADSRVLEGEIAHFFGGDIVMIKKGETTETFTVRNVLQYSFLDTAESRARVFYSLNSKDDKLKFYEIIKEFKNFAVLMKENVEMVAVHSPMMNTTQSVHVSGTDGSNQRESLQKQICIAFDGDIEPYIGKTKNAPWKLNFGGREWSKGYFIDKNLLKDLTKEFYP